MNNSIIIGYNSFIYGDSESINNSVVIGHRLTTSYSNQFICGKYNEDKNTARFIVGCGTGNTARANCFEVGITSGENPEKYIQVGNGILTETQINTLSNIIRDYLQQKH